MKNGTTIPGPVALSVETSRFADYMTLTKPRIVLLVVLCTAVGFVVGTSGAVSAYSLIHAIIGTALVAAGGATLNQYRERAYDALMHRTEDRPLPAGRLEPRDALAMGTSLGVIGIAWLGTFVNLLTAAVGVLSIITYIFVYTPLKRRTHWCILAGSVTGALPPVMGWTAATGSLDWGALGLFAILYAWQIPHFLAIAWMYRDDYNRGGFAMEALTGADGRHVITRIRITTIVMLIAGLLPALIGSSGSAYLIAAIILGLGFHLAAWRWRAETLATYTRRVFAVSLAYLPMVLCALALSHLL